MTPAFDHLLSEIRTLHDTFPSVGDFVSYPSDLRSIELKSQHLPSTDHFLAESQIKNAQSPLVRAFYNASSDARWRINYADSNIGDDFMQRFACYCVAGEGGAWYTNQTNCML